MKSTSLNSQWLSKIENILVTAEDYHIESGLSWYDRANNFAVMTGITYDVPTDKVAKIIAILSPGVEWERNKRDTWLLLSWASLTEEQIANLPFGTFKANVKKAWRVYHDLEDLLPKSQKTFAFYRNIMLDPDHVTIDRHAITAIGGKKFLHKILYKSKGASSSFKISKDHYNKAVNAYRRMANKYNLTPFQLQAIVWEVERTSKLKGIEGE